MKLGLKLPLLFALSLFLLFAAGLFGIHRLNAAVNTYEKEVLQRVAAHKKAAEVSAHFSVAIQEWKNVLLRGKDAKDLEKYWSAHNKEMDEVNRLLGELKELATNEEERSLVKKLTAEMLVAQDGYRKALEDFKASGFDHTAGDKSARGKDREAASQLATLRERLSASEKEVSQAASASAESATYTALAVMVLVTIAALLVSVTISHRIVTHLGTAVLVARKVSHGELNNVIESQGTDEIAELLQSLQEMQSQLISLVTHVQHNADQVAHASAEIAQGNHDLSVRTEEQASALQETVSSMMELGAAVHDSADNARHAAQFAQDASSVAAEGGQVVQKVVSTMQGIDQSAHRIADIISVIDGIAFQTNILALNAAVEAARAGEQGRGFAVVASEVRLLAGRSATAAKEIKALITASVERVEHGTALVAQAGSTMEAVVASIRKVSDVVKDISAAASEQNTKVAQVGLAVHRIDETTQRNAALVEEMSAAASGLKGQASALLEAISVFHLGGASTQGLQPQAFAISRAASSSLSLSKPATGN